jgi:hypothetical protein
MDDTAYREFFQQPAQTYHRRYEALRAVFVDRRSQKEVAKTFGYTHDSMRQLVGEFRHTCDAEDQSAESPFFGMSRWDVPWPMTTAPTNRPWPIVES